MPKRTAPPPERPTEVLEKSTADLADLVPGPLPDTPLDFALDTAVAHRDAVLRVLEQIEALSGSITPTADALANGEELEVLLDFYGRLADARRTVDAMTEQIGKAIIRIAPDRFASYAVPGGGHFKIGGGQERTSYDNDRLARDLASKIIAHLNLAAVVTGDGEEGDPAPVVFQIVNTVIKATGSGVASFKAWRSTVLKELGMNVKDYAEMSSAPLTHRIEGRTP